MQRHAIEQRTVDAPEARTVDVDVEALDTRGNTLVGYAAVYNVESRDLGGFRERIAPGAFAQVLRDADVRALLNHDPNAVLGRSKAGTLRLSDEQRGLRFEVDLPDSPLGQNVKEAVRRGDIDGASFRFVADEDEWDGDLRTVKSIKELHDVTIATYGAYPAASVELRTRAPQPELTPRQGGGLVVRERNGRPEQRTADDALLEAIRDVPPGESRALTTAIAVSNTEISTVLFDRLRAASIFLSTGVRVLATDSDSVQYPTVTADASPDMYAEGGTITPGDPTLSTVTATPRKMAHLVQMSNEVIDDSDPSVTEVVRDHLLRVMALKADQQLLEGTGTAPQVRGLKNVASIQTLAAATNGQAITFDNVADAIALLEGVNVPTSRLALILHPRNIGTLRKLKASTAGTYLWSDAVPSADAPRRIFGVPVFTSPQLSTNETQGTSGAVCNSGYLIDTQNVVFVRRNDISIELDRSRLFNSDQSELRGTWRFDLIAPSPNAIVRITGFTS